MDKEQPMQFMVTKGFELAGEDWRPGEVITVINSPDGKKQLSTMDGKDATVDEAGFQSIRDFLKNVSRDRE